MIFLIEKVILDPLENTVSAAVGATPVGYVESEEVAKRICKASKVLTHNDCWAISYVKELRYIPLGVFLEKKPDIGTEKL